MKITNSSSLFSKASDSLLFDSADTPLLLNFTNSNSFKIKNDGKLLTNKICEMILSRIT